MLGSIFTALVAAAAVQAHILISYPGSRGNNLITNSSHPYGMQWEYPCTFLSPPSHSHNLEPFIPPLSFPFPSTTPSLCTHKKGARTPG